MTRAPAGDMHVMSQLLRFLYDGAAQLAIAATVVVPPSESKALRAFNRRRGLRRRYEEWVREARDRTRPLLWVHAPSVGEGLQARPVLALARARMPEVQLAYTFFSPSAERFAGTLDVDFRDYLPFDTRSAARFVIDRMEPSALVFSKLDVWPNLVREAARRGVKLGLISATLSTSSRRPRRIAAALLRGAYACLDAVAAIDGDDAERLVRLGVRRDVVTVAGDTRYDQVWQRTATIAADESLLAPLRSSQPTLVAGSTWTADERPLLLAWEIVRQRLPGARLIIAPHEPTRAHLEPIESWARVASVRLARLADAGADTEVVLVDRVGVLGALYALADVAFVGGGFHAAGLHSVLEPAAFGAPVLYGPRFGNSRDAMRLSGSGGRAVRDAGEMADAVLAWFGDDAARRSAGDAARAMVRNGLGAAERSWSVVSGLLPHPDAT